MKRRIYTLDVFTTRPYAGNPLAVVTDGDGLSHERMQAIAREMNLSETVFVQKPTNDKALARLRIFTTTQELPLAGHPVIGTWFLLAELGVVPASEGVVHVTQQLEAGLLPVEIVFEEGRPSRVTMTQTPARFFPCKVSKPRLMQSLGLKASDLHRKLPLEYVSTGIFNLMVPLRAASVLKKIKIDIHALANLMADRGVMAYCFAPDGKGKARARGMLPWELNEDPATGSACGSMAAYLVHHGTHKAGEKLSVLQGVEMGRESHIEVNVMRQSDGKLVPYVSGSAVRIMEGHIEA